MTETTYKANIDAKDFDRMVKNLKGAISKTNACNSTPLTTHIHLEFQANQVKCVALDGYRIHEEYLYAEVSAPFSCHIVPPKLSSSQAIGVQVSLEDGVAYVEFDNVRFATKQSKTPLNVVDSSKIMEMIGDDERHEILINANYLLDAVKALKSKNGVVLNIGDPNRPMILRPYQELGCRACYILPRRIYRQFSKQNHETEQLKKLKAIQNRLNLILSENTPAESDSDADFWNKASAFKEDLDNYLKNCEQ